MGVLRQRDNKSQIWFRASLKNAVATLRRVKQNGAGDGSPRTTTHCCIRTTATATKQPKAYPDQRTPNHLHTRTARGLPMGRERLQGGGGPVRKYISQRQNAVDEEARSPMQIAIPYKKERKKHSTHSPDLITAARRGIIASIITFA